MYLICTIVSLQWHAASDVALLSVAVIAAVRRSSAGMKKKSAASLQTSLRAHAKRPSRERLQSENFKHNDDNDTLEPKKAVRRDSPERVFQGGDVALGCRRVRIEEQHVRLEHHQVELAHAQQQSVV